MALGDLVHRYAALVDDRDPAGVAALFAEDGVLATAAPPATLEPSAEHVGPRAVAEALATLDGLDATFHAITGQVFDTGADADTATGRIACLAHHVSRRGDEPRDLLWAVTYRDRYRREGGAWRFTRRAVHLTFVATLPLRQAKEAHA